MALVVIDAEGIDPHRILAQKRSTLPAIVLSSGIDQGLLVSWFRAGAADCLSALDRSRLRGVLESLLAPQLFRGRQAEQQRQVVARSASMAGALRSARRLLSTAGDVLISGEKGTGKSQVARLCIGCDVGAVRSVGTANGQQGF